MRCGRLGVGVVAGVLTGVPKPGAAGPYVEVGVGAGSVDVPHDSTESTYRGGAASLAGGVYVAPELAIVARTTALRAGEASSAVIGVASAALIFWPVPRVSIGAGVGIGYAARSCCPTRTADAFDVQLGVSVSPERHIFVAAELFQFKQGQEYGPQHVSAIVFEVGWRLF